MVCLSVILLCYRIMYCDFVIKDFVIKEGSYLCWTLYLSFFKIGLFDFLILNFGVPYKSWKPALYK